MSSSTLEQLCFPPDAPPFVQVLESWYNYKDEICPKEGKKQSYAKSTNATTYNWGDDGGGVYSAAGNLGIRSCFEYSKYFNFGIAGRLVQRKISMESFSAFCIGLSGAIVYHRWPVVRAAGFDPCTAGIVYRSFNLL